MQNALGSPRFRRRALLVCGAVVVAALALWFASRIPRTLSVFVIAAFIAFGVAPVVARLERRIPRGAAIALVYVSLIAIVIVLALLVIPETLAQLQSIAVNAPDYITLIQTWVDSAQHFLAHRFGKTYLPPGTGDLQGYVASRVSLGFAALLASFSQIVFGAFTAAFVGISAVVLSAFFLLQGETVAEPLYSLLPSHRRSTARGLGVELAHVFGSYVSGQAALCTVTGLLIFAFTLATGFKFALLLGIVSGLAYAVPFVGMLLAHAVGLVLAAPQGLQTVIWVQVIIFTVARIADNVLVPKIMSESVGVSPIVVMFAVFAGGELFGLPGLVLGIPAAALAKVAWRFFRQSRTAPADAAVVEIPPTVIVAEPQSTVVVAEPQSTVVVGEGPPAASKA